MRKKTNAQRGPVSSYFMFMILLVLMIVMVIYFPREASSFPYRR
jgi:hypothetical protein